MRIVRRQVNEGKAQVAVIVPVADAEDRIAQRFLDNLRASTTIPLDVLLVESSGGEFAYGKSMNAGIRAAEGHDLVMGMDSDAFPRKGAVDLMLQFAKEHPRVGFTGARIVTPGCIPNIGWVHQGMGWFVIGALKAKAPLFAVRRILKGKWWSFSIRSPKDFVPGRMVGAITTAFVLRRKCFEDVGPFDEGYRVSFVDVDYSFRIMTSADWYVSTCASAEVFHEGHTTRIARREKMEFEGWDKFLSDWPKQRIANVLEASRKGKFIIPEEKWRAVPDITGQARP